MSYWEDKNVFVTGAFGFVGSWLTKMLVEKGANVFVMEYKKNSFTNFYYLGLNNKVRKIIEGSITDLNLLQKTVKENNIETCFHLAAQAIVGTGFSSPLPTFETNINGTLNVLEACRTSDSVEQVVVMSSDKAYGRHKELPYREDFPLLPADPYSTSKACADLLSQSFAKVYRMPVAIVRSANIYGGGDLNFSRVVPSISRDVIFNKRPQITTRGTAVRDFIYVSDIVSAFLTLGEKLNHSNVKGEAFNFTGETPISILDLVKKIIEVSGKKLEPEILGVRDEAKEIDKQYLSYEKAKKVLNWRPKTSLGNGLRETLDFYEKFFSSNFYKELSKQNSSK